MLVKYIFHLIQVLGNSIFVLEFFWNTNPFEIKAQLTAFYYLYSLRNESLKTSRDGCGSGALFISMV